MIASPVIPAGKHHRLITVTPDFGEFQTGGLAERRSKDSSHSPLRGSRRGRAEWRRPIRWGGTAPAPPALCESHSRDAAFRPPPARPRAEPHPGTRASRPHPYSSLEVVERRRNVAGRQPPCRRELRWPVRMKGKAPLPFRPGGGVGQGCAGLMCGRDARVPGWAIIHTTNREHD